MRYIHGKDWGAKLIKAVIAERMKPSKSKPIPKIQMFNISDTSKLSYFSERYSPDQQNPEAGQNRRNNKGRRPGQKTTEIKCL